jgi:D-threo-aldose 1-dehydrogenase
MRLGLGGGPLGGLFEAVDEETASAVVERAWERGIRYFDVAPLYGHGRSERFLGNVLRTKPRDEFTLSTKVGRLLRTQASGSRSDFVETEGVGPVFDFSAAGVQRSFEESLERLGLDRVDMLLIHDPDRHLDQAVAEAYPAVRRMREQGIVKSVGVGTNSCATALRFVRETDADCVLLANRITLLDRSGFAVMRECSERGVTLVAGGVFNSGVLAGEHGRFEYRIAADDIRERVRRLARVCASYDASLTTAALQFPLRHGVETIVVGARSVAEVDEDIEAFETALPDELWEALDRE